MKEKTIILLNYDKKHLILANDHKLIRFDIKFRIKIKTIY